MPHANLEGLKERFTPRSQSAPPPVQPEPQLPPQPLPTEPILPDEMKGKQDLFDEHVNADTPPAAPAKKPDTPAAPSADSLMDHVLGVKPAAPAAKQDDPGLPKGPDPVPEDVLKRLPPGQQQAIRNQRAHIEKLEQALAEAKKTSGHADVEAFKQRLAEVEKVRDEAITTLEKLSLEHSPRFRQKYAEPKTRLLKQISSYLKSFGVEDESIASKAAAMPIKERIAFLSLEAGDAMGAVVPLFAQIDAIEDERMTELSASKEAFARNEQERKTAGEEFRKKHVAAALDDAVKNGHFIFREVPENPELNATIGQLRKTVDDVFASADPTVQSRAMAGGVAAPIYLSMLIKERERTKVLESELSKYRRSIPRISGERATADEPRLPARMTAEEAAARLADRAG